MPLERVAIDNSPHYPGEVRHFSCLTLPVRWLPPDGQAVSRSLYPRLFTAYVNTQQARVTAGNNTMICTDSSLFAIGCLIVGAGVPANTRVIGRSGTSVAMSVPAITTTTIQNYIFHLHGLGDGSTTFNLPDYRGRDLIGAGQGAGLTNRLLGQSGGVEKVGLIAAENGQHNHIGFNGGTQFVVDGGGGGANIAYAAPGSYALAQMTQSGNGSPHENMMPFGVIQLGVFTG